MDMSDVIQKAGLALRREGVILQRSDFGDNVSSFVISEKWDGEEKVYGMTMVADRVKRLEVLVG